MRVFAASSLTDAFTSIAREFEVDNPGVALDLDFGGSQRLRSQIEFGAKADLFASADNLQMDALVAADLVFGQPVIFTANNLVVIATPDGPVDAISDLAKPGVRVVLAHSSVPAGGYSRQMLINLAEDSALGLGPVFKDQVLANLVSEEPNVRFVAQKVALQEVDAGIVYQTDVAAAEKTANIDVILIRQSANVKAQYPIAVIRDTPDPGLAQSFLQFVLSDRGQRLLIKHGFTAP
ncbi:MAG: molybdate ABC transporter substrate-binding protein [Chloroflexi bacterium]|nr:molybdate ABC transporter substrate-binding protein [Chloroflexota bacterium]